MNDEIKSIIGDTIANCRGGRNGAPPIKNVLEILPPKLHKEVLGDADAIVKALLEAGYVIEKKAV